MMESVPFGGAGTLSPAGLILGFVFGLCETLKELCPKVCDRGHAIGQLGSPPINSIGSSFLLSASL